MSAIHVIKNDQRLPQIVPVQPGSDIYRSGYWVISEGTADALVGGRIYFHDQQAKPSFYGGVIIAAEKIREGEYADRVVFTFRFDPACRGISTPRDGWAQEVKIIL